MVESVRSAPPLHSAIQAGLEGLRGTALFKPIKPIKQSTAGLHHSFRVFSSNNSQWSLNLQLFQMNYSLEFVHTLRVLPCNKIWWVFFYRKMSGSFIDRLFSRWFIMLNPSKPTRDIHPALDDGKNTVPLLNIPGLVRQITKFVGKIRDIYESNRILLLPKILKCGKRDWTEPQMGHVLPIDQNE